MDQGPLELLRLLLARLERISVDSYWAHRASGIRGSLLRALEELELGHPIQTSGLEALVAKGFDILEKAAIEKTSRTTKEEIFQRSTPSNARLHF